MRVGCGRGRDGVRVRDGAVRCGPSRLLVGGESESHRRSLGEIEAELAALPAEQVDAMVKADAIVEVPARELPAVSGTSLGPV